VSNIASGHLSLQTGGDAIMALYCKSTDQGQDPRISDQNTKVGQILQHMHEGAQFSACDSGDMAVDAAFVGGIGLLVVGTVGSMADAGTWAAEAGISGTALMILAIGVIATGVADC
jgi:hypothetical protein